MKISTLVAMSIAALTLSGTALVGCSSETNEGPEEPAALTAAEVSGRWVSGGCESYPDGNGGENHLTRDFTLTEKDWTLELVVFGDDACSYPLFSAHVEGPYSLGALSEKVEGATEGNFEFGTIEWTALDQGMADIFSQSGCGTGAWKVGEAQDVTATGCIGVAHAKSECPVDHDIVSLDGDTLFFGERVTDMCKEEGRPLSLGSYAVFKK
ncbi:MAG: hypothetical protein R3B70_36610 [Polyangiaceae bacterium]